MFVMPGVCLALVALLMLPPPFHGQTVQAVHAQHAESNAEESSPLTLRTYVNLVQIPVLVLSQKRTRAEPVKAEDISLSIDSGPYFPPKHLRREGLDPIRLVIFLDINAETRNLLGTLDTALHDLSRSLTDNDDVSISVFRGSSLIQTESVVLTPASIGTLSAFVQQQLQVPDRADSPIRRENRASHLWDAATHALTDFGTTRSRRLLLLVTDGRDQGSRTTLQELRLRANALGVTVFALRMQPAAEIRWNEYVLHRDSFGYAKARSEVGDPLVTLTSTTGGMTLETRDHPLAEGLMRVMRLVRERYIVDFTRPSKLGGGAHSIDVRMRDKKLFVTWAGLGVPLPDPAIVDNPSTVPSNPASEPPIGTRRVLPK